jgi:hypothetical protein
MRPTWSLLLVSHAYNDIHQILHRYCTAGWCELRCTSIFLVLGIRHKIFPCLVQHFALHNELSLGRSSTLSDLSSLRHSSSNIPPSSSILVEFLPLSFLEDLIRSLPSLGQFLVIKSSCDNIIWVLSSYI